METGDPYARALEALKLTDAVTVFERGLYAAPPAALAWDVVDRVQAERGAQLLVLGGIGTGKTTQLVATARALGSEDGTVPVYVETSRYVRLSKPRAGVLVALAALARWRLLRDAGVLLPASERLTLARLHAGLRPSTETEPGLLDPQVVKNDGAAFDLPSASVPDLVRYFGDLGRFDRAITSRPIVLLLDDLDRVETVATLNEFIREDLPALRSLGVGVVIAGSVAWRFQLERDLVVSPDVLQWRRVPDPDASAERAFLVEVIRRRVPGSLLDDAAAELIVRGSGGVMRDLVQVAKAALFNARRARHSHVEAADVRDAVGALAERRLLFLSPERQEVIRSIQATGSVVGHLGALEDLLASCDVLMRSPPNNYRVHPAVQEALALREVA